MNLQHQLLDEAASNTTISSSSASSSYLLSSDATSSSPAAAVAVAPVTAPSTIIKVKKEKKGDESTPAKATATSSSRSSADYELILAKLYKELEAEREKNRRGLTTTSSSSHQRSSFKDEYDTDGNNSTDTSATTPAHTSVGSRAIKKETTMPQQQKHASAAAINRTTSSRSSSQHSQQPAQVKFESSAAATARVQAHDDGDDSEEEREAEKHDADLNEEVFDEEDDNHPYNSYNRWLRVREKLYPYTSNIKLYRSRYTLLSYNGRMLEYFRFGLMTRFPIKLYPSVCQRWYKRLLHERNIEKDDTHSRPVSRNAILIPQFYYDDNENRIRTTNIHQNDIPPHSLSLGKINMVLKTTPPSTQGQIVTTVEQVIELYIRQRKTLAELTSDTYGAVSREEAASSTSYRRSSDDNESDEEDEVQEVYGELPQLEDANASNNVSASLWYQNPQLAEKMSKERQEKLKAASAAAQSRVAATLTSAIALPSGITGSLLGPIWNDLDDHTRRTILAVRQPERLSVDTLAKREKEVIQSLNKFDGMPANAPKYFQSLCVKLGTYDFKCNNAVRIMMSTTVGSANTWMISIVGDIATDTPDSDKIAQVLGKFRRYYLTATQAAAYRKQLTGTKLVLPADKFIGVNELERHYASFIKILTDLRICDRQISERDAISYYLDSLPQFIYSFLGTSHLTMDTVDEVHRNAILAVRPHEPATARKPPREHVDHQAADDVDVEPSSSSSSSSSRSFQHAPKHHNKRPPRPLPTPTAMHKKRDKGIEILESEGAAKYDEYHKQLIAKMKCFHCGRTGHAIIDCKILKAAQPQTPDGAHAWANYNAMRGKNIPYDSSVLIDRWKNKSALIAKIKESLKKKSPRPPAETVDDDSVDCIDTTVDTDGENRDTDSSKQVFTLSAIGEAVRGEKAASRPLSTKLEMNGISVNNALVDSGCSKLLIRREAFDKYHLDAHVYLTPIDNHVVRTASGHEIPITHRFQCALTVDGIPFNNAAVAYVVEAKDGHDINVDVVLGRHAIAQSNYRLIDTLKGRLVSHRCSEDYLQCHAAKIDPDAEGGIILLSRQPYKNLLHSTSAVHQRYPLHSVISMTVTKEEVPGTTTLQHTNLSPVRNISEATSTAPGGAHALSGTSPSTSTTNSPTSEKGDKTDILPSFSPTTTTVTDPPATENKKTFLSDPVATSSTTTATITTTPTAAATAVVQKNVPTCEKPRKQKNTALSDNHLSDAPATTTTTVTTPNTLTTTTTALTTDRRPLTPPQRS